MVMAYIDPGAGSMAIQMLIAAGLAVPFFLRTHITRGMAKLRRRGGTGSQERPSGN